MSLSNIMQQHLIFGAGLIGCYLGGVLTIQGKSPSLICRAKNKQKLKAGIRLTDYLGNDQRSGFIHCIDPSKYAASLPLKQPIDFLWLTVKCTAIEQAVIDMQPWVTSSTVILCCQNGLGTDAMVKAAYPHNIVLRVMLPFNVVELATGHFHRGSEGALTIEQTPVCKDNIVALVKELHCHLLPMASNSDIHSLLWAKLQLNLGNSVNALANIPVKAMLEQVEYRKVLALLMKELLMVTDALNIRLPKITAVSAHKLPFILRLPNFIFSRVANKMLQIDPNVRSSMWWDISEGKTTEIAYINGAVLDHARVLGIYCPTNQKICDLIGDLEKQKRLQGKSNHRLPHMSFYF